MFGLIGLHQLLKEPLLAGEISVTHSAGRRYKTHTELCLSLHPVGINWH